MHFKKCFSSGPLINIRFCTQFCILFHKEGPQNCISFRPHKTLICLIAIFVSPQAIQGVVPCYEVLCILPKELNIQGNVVRIL
jgi:hypothetical protein